MFSVWDDFIIWTSHNEEELMKLGIIDMIDHEFGEVFSYLGAYVWNISEPYSLIYNISAFITSYLRHCYSSLYFRKNASDILRNLISQTLKQILFCWNVGCMNASMKKLKFREAYMKLIASKIFKLSSAI